MSDMNSNQKTQRGEANKAERRRRDTSSLTGQRKRLAVDESKLDRENFVYRFANDDEHGRIHSLTVNDDWEIVQDRDNTISKNSGGDGTKVSIHAGSGERGAPMKTVLLRKPKPYHDEDFAKRQRHIDETEAGLRKGATPGGETDNQYIPSSGIQIGRG